MRTFESQQAEQADQADQVPRHIRFALGQAALGLGLDSTGFLVLLG
jgi:hypothetical protein